MKKYLAAGAALVAACAFAGAAGAQTVIDLTHPIPTYQPMEGDPSKADTGKPWGDNRAFPSFGPPAVLSISEFPTNQGHFDLGVITLAEHHGTHFDSAAHYMNNEGSVEQGGIAPADRAQMHMLKGSDIVGKIVLIDISARVKAELDKNGGKPGDKSVTDFSNSSNNVVTADDIAAVADQIDNNVWIVMHLGWSQFYFQGADFVKDPYINAFNFPGINKEAVDKLIEIMASKGVQIAGIAADNIGIDSGESGYGEDDKWTNSWYAHVRLQQRNVKFVENAANLDQLAAVGDTSNCLLSIGALKHVRGTGGPARVVAICP